MPISYNYWVYSTSTSPARMQVNGSDIGAGAVNNVYELQHKGASYTYSIKKNYQIVTHVVKSYVASGSFSVSPGGWSDTLKYSGGMTPSGNPGTYSQTFLHYSSPSSPVTTNTQVIYNANGTFSNTAPNKPGITDFKINEIDFKVQGFAYYKLKDRELQPDITNSLGWYYDKDQDVYNWYDRITGSPSSDVNAKAIGYFPVGGSNNSKVADIGFRLNNYLIKLIPYSYYNIHFNYQNLSDFPLKIYTSLTSPSSQPSNWNSSVYTPPNDAILLATITQSMSGTYSSYNYYIPHSFYGLKGNQYLYFVGGFAGVTASGTTYSFINLKNLKVEGGYHSGNNRRYTMTIGTYSSTTLTSLSGATYTAYVGNGNTVNATYSLTNPGINQIFSKIGNGTFNAGIWENGVWNSGWRVDTNMSIFHNIQQFFAYNRNKRWRVQISGPTSSVANFNIGDNVSIGNIVAIDINEDRKLLKGYYTIINKTDSSIIVEFDNNFPIRRIEKDSENHRIYITKNVWLSGGFLNGYFTGIWNYGLFKGYPLITEMFDSHWIDGTFDGGHFNTTLYSIPDFTSTLSDKGKLKLIFTQSHGLAVNDLINIDKNDKSINIEYDGDHYVTSIVDDYQVITDVDYGVDSLLESGKITAGLSKGVLQSVNFKSNNISKVTSNVSMESDAVFIYNSWIDVTYDNSYASNIGKPQTLLNALSRKSYSENNLYGYITNDVLESNSSFRDSFSTAVRKYRLGTKYKIFGDFIGNAGNFEDEFGSISATNSTLTSASESESTFIKYGWTFSKFDSSSLTFSRTRDLGIQSIMGEELKVQAVSSGGILDITPLSDIYVENKLEEEVKKLRYTKIEFDLVTYSNNIAENGYTPYDFGKGVKGFLTHIPYSYKLPVIGGWLYEPHIHFNNLNYVNRAANSIGFAATASISVPATYLPIYQNVNHITTKKKRKVEYFYNKRNLAMHFYGINSGTTDTAEYIIDNLHFYEIDMIPFFQYFTDDNINRGVQVPFQGISPFIDYSNASFNFIDNISIGLDSIQTQNSNTTISGVGIGIGSAISSGVNSTIYAQEGNFTINQNLMMAINTSDVRLKTNINKIGISNSGINIYTFEFIDKPNEVYQGIIAQELIGTKFESATRIESDGYYHVDYSKLDVEFKKIN